MVQILKILELSYHCKEKIYQKRDSSKESKKAAFIHFTFDSFSSSSTSYKARIPHFHSIQSRRTKVMGVERIEEERVKEKEEEVLFYEEAKNTFIFQSLSSRSSCSRENKGKKKLRGKRKGGFVLGLSSSSPMTTTTPLLCGPCCGGPA